MLGAPLHRQVKHRIEPLEKRMVIELGVTEMIAMNARKEDHGSVTDYLVEGCDVSWTDLRRRAPPPLARS